MKIITSLFILLLSFGAIGQSYNRIDAMRLIQEGDNFLRMGNWEYALSRYNDAIVMDPDYADALMKRSVLYEQTGRAREASMDYQRALSLNPYSAHIYDLRLRKDMIASDYINPINQQERSNLEIERMLDDCIQWDSYELALANIDTLLLRGYNQQLELEKKALVYFLKNDLKSSMDAINQIQKISDSSYMAMDLEGLIFLKNGKNKDAIYRFSQAIAINPSFPVFYFNRAMAYRLDGNNEAALIDLNSAIKKSKDNAEAYVLRALIKKEDGDLNGALKDYSSAIDANPENSDALHNRGYVLKLMGDYNAALNDANALVRLDPNSAEHWNLKGNMHFLYNQYREAIEAYTNTIAMNPEYAEAYYNRGLAQLMNYMPRQGCSDLRESENLGYEGAQAMYINYCGK
jgi:tetratricopeptide (TPR) repeat protein